MSFSRTRTRTHSRTIAAVGFLLASGLFLTACDSDSPEPTASSTPASTPASASASASVSAEASIAATTDPNGDSGSETPSSGTPEGSTPEASVGTSGGEQATVDNRVDGTVTGTLTYLAPGKLEVGGRPFYVAVDTDIRGGDICGDPESQSAEACTPDELDAAAQGGNLTVEVTIKKGIAERVVQA
ncbi:hypothetical protein [Streptomyces geranii]|uniref:hypothetical protein n=1 Tax=Streptomyces geranii TaxID=2058923 RepID=UPI000D03F965|nr:hypothetical protein [Streptomyces geranii]